MISDTIFKLKHDIANDSELQLAVLELESILTIPPKPVRNLADTLIEVEPLRESVLTNSPTRIQDIFLRMPYPGKLQGYQAKSLPKSLTIRDLNRLTYFRDIFVIFSGNPKQVLEQLKIPDDRFTCSDPAAESPDGQRLSHTTSLHKLNRQGDQYLLRIIAPHCFLECTDHVVRLAQRTHDVDRMYDAALKHLQSNFSRPFAASVQMGFKWIEDFIDDRRPPNAYASHSLFGLRGRFFPRMVRALTNYLSYNFDCPSIVDPFCGVGTLGIECSLLRVQSESYDINPFFVEVSRAKHHALLLSDREICELENLRAFATELRAKETSHAGIATQHDLFDAAANPPDDVIPVSLARNTNKESLELLHLLREKIATTCSPENRRVALLAIAYYASSMAKKYTRPKILGAFWGHLSRIIYLSRFMRRLYDDNIIEPPLPATFEVGDARDLSREKTNVASILTSPPYTTAIDYIGNDLFGYYALGFKDHGDLEKRMIGGTRLGPIATGQTSEWALCVPSVAKRSHSKVESENGRKASLLAKYFYDMTKTLSELKKALSDGGQMVMIVCREQDFGAGPRIKYPIAESIIEIANKEGLGLNRRIDVSLTKNSDGDIKEDCALMFSK